MSTCNLMYVYVVKCMPTVVKFMFGIITKCLKSFMCVRFENTTYYIIILASEVGYQYWDVNYRIYDRIITDKYDLAAWIPITSRSNPGWPLHH